MPDKMLDLVLNNPVVTGVPKEFFISLAISLEVLAACVGFSLLISAVARLVQALRG